MHRLLPVLAAAAFLCAGLSAAPVHAAGEGSTSTRVPNCKKNMVWDKRKKKCVEAKKSSGLSDDNIYEFAKSLAYARRYDEALVVLSLAADPYTPRMLTYRGFATRKAGDVRSALPFYEAALAMDPDYTLAREYMGEAYLQIGRVDLAREQLAEIEKQCGATCDEFAALERQIAAFGRSSG